MAKKVKLTVLRRECYSDLQKQYLADPDAGKCPLFKEGQEIIFDNEGYMTMNHGQFCMEAWAGIRHYIYTALNGGAMMKGWNREDGTMIVCCNDGTRPVVFKLETIDED